jgi:hypothetical protein
VFSNFSLNREKTPDPEIPVEHTTYVVSRCSHQMVGSYEEFLRAFPDASKRDQSRVRRMFMSHPKLSLTVSPMR